MQPRLKGDGLALNKRERGSQTHARPLVKGFDGSFLVESLEFRDSSHSLQRYTAVFCNLFDLESARTTTERGQFITSILRIRLSILEIFRLLITAVHLQGCRQAQCHHRRKEAGAAGANCASSETTK